MCWIIELLYELEIPVRIDPWVIGPRRDKLPDVPQSIDLDESETVAFGAGVDSAISEFRPQESPERLMRDDGKAVFETMRKGAPIGAESYLERHESSCKAGPEFLGRIRG